MRVQRGPRRLAPLCASALVIAVCASAAPARSAASAAALPSFPSKCLANTLEVKPRSIVVACGDGNFYLTSLKWDRWSSRHAHGTGRAHTNDCVPFCAAGRFHRYRIAVSLSRPVTCASGAREFTKIAWRYPGRRPKGPRTGSVKFGCV